jgi:hypothetical protein
LTGKFRISEFGFITHPTANKLRIAFTEPGPATPPAAGQVAVTGAAAAISDKKQRQITAAVRSDTKQGELQEPGQPQLQGSSIPDDIATESWRRPGRGILSLSTAAEPVPAAATAAVAVTVAENEAVTRWW